MSTKCRGMTASRPYTRNATRAAMCRAGGTPGQLSSTSAKATVRRVQASRPSVGSGVALATMGQLKTKATIVQALKTRVERRNSMSRAFSRVSRRNMRLRPSGLSRRSSGSEAAARGRSSWSRYLSTCWRPPISLQSRQGRAVSDTQTRAESSPSRERRREQGRGRWLLTRSGPPSPCGRVW